MNEILLTAAQSLLAVALLVRLRLDPRGALLLSGLFVGQFLAPSAFTLISHLLPLKVDLDSVHLLFSGAYVLAAAYFLLKNRVAVADLRHGLAIERVPSSLRLAPALVKSCPSDDRVHPESA